MAVGAVLLVILAIVANLVWKDYSTALMESQTRDVYKRQVMLIVAVFLGVVPLH